MDKEELEKYVFSGNYIGVIAGDYDHYCPLKLNEINNFVQNIGLHCDLEIFREEDNEIEMFFNTFGTYINRIWPELSMSDRNACQDVINQVAQRMIEEFDNDKNTEILPEVKEFLVKGMKVDMENHMELKQESDMLNEFEMQM